MAPGYLQWQIRVATDPKWGGGHLARMLVLAESLVEHRSTRLLIDAGCDRLRDELLAQGYGTELATSAEPAGQSGTVVDGYDFSEIELRKYGSQGPLAIMHDEGEPASFADLLVNSSFGLSGDFLYGLPALLGPRYGLVSPRFADIRAPVSNVVRHILVIFGHLDQFNATGLALEALSLALASPDDCQVTVVLGSRAPHLNTVRRQIADLGDRYSMLVGVSDMPATLTGVDLIIGAGGVSLFERALAGIPSISMTIAENHRRFTEEAGKQGVTLYAGVAREIDASALAETIRDIVDSDAQRAKIAAIGPSIVDGGGSHRIVERLLALEPGYDGKVHHLTAGTGR